MTREAVASAHHGSLAEPLGRHVLLPLVPSLFVVGLYLTPLSVVSCRTRGLVALVVVVAALVAGIVAALLAVRRRAAGDPSGWLVASALLCLLPALLVFGPLA